MYVDQPRNVGFSFGYGEPSRSSVEAADDFVVFYSEWLKLFPEFENRKMIIAGESYGGHYIPAWSTAILDHNNEYPDAKFNYVGAVIGNGCVNDTVQNTEEYIKFQHENDLIPADSNPRNQLAAQKEMVDYIGYNPNYYDYRIQDITCPACYSYNYTGTCILVRLYCFTLYS